MAENAREIVLDTLLEIERTKVFSNQLLKSVLDKYDYLESQEKRFIKRVTEGCIERKIELDYYLNQYSTVPVNKMKPFIRCLMRMGVYQILYMDKIPDSAACNEAVNLAVKRKFGNLRGFVNGVLRKISRNKEQLPMPKEDSIEYLSVKYSMPDWIIGMWLESYTKEEVIVILNALSEIHPISVRFRKDLPEEARKEFVDKWKQQGAVIRKSEILPYVYSLEAVDGVNSLAGFDEGIFTVQDISSVLCVEAAKLTKEHICMDICAAPGGKSILAAEMCKQVLARDLTDGKVSLIHENCQRMNVSDNVETEVFDATVFDEGKREYADVVFMDVPCSGLGVMGKKRDIKYHVTPDSLESLVDLQKEIVQNSWQYVKKGGVLMYSTCTIHNKENQQMVRWICERFPFELEEEKQILPGYMQADGFYYARLRRKVED